MLQSMQVAAIQPDQNLLGYSQSTVVLPSSMLLIRGLKSWHDLTDGRQVIDALLWFSVYKLEKQREKCRKAFHYIN